MNWYDYLFIYISCCASVYFVTKSCGKLLNIDKVKPLIKLICVLFGGLIITYSIYNSGTYEHIIISLTVLSLCGLLMFRNSINKTIFNIMVCYLIALIIEIILAIIIVNIMGFNVDTFNSNSFVKSIYSILDVFLAYLACSLKIVKKIVNKITNKNIVLNSILSIVIIALIILDAKYLLLASNKVYIGNIIILVSLMYLLVFSIITNQKLSNEYEKTEILLNSMTKYEKIIDDNRMFKHELLNNLLILKSFKNKNSKEFNGLLDELIDSKNDKNISIKNIYNLPSGLKGFFYYKLYNLETEKYNIRLNISKEIGTSLKNISRREYVDLYRIVGIVLDNAIEASAKTKDKVLIIDIYEENNEICFDISNSFKGNVDLNTINNKGITTKGNNRGIGLYIAKKILLRSNKITMNQSVNNKIFTTNIKVSL